ncbi:HEPN domain-containing protein [Candidatus Pacearchaeota archaeon]|nr:HEPN domain-containing protein [Candidatus Pacearchaeota archaeon]
MDDEIKQRVFQQVMDIFVTPEIERRRKEGKIKDGTIISKMQIIFSLDKGKNVVRLNEEIKAIATGRANKSINKGQIVYEDDIDNIEKIELTDNDINCGHITLLLFKNNWIISFDFRYNKERIKEHIEASKKFYESALDNLNKNRLRPFYENAFASSELSAKSVLLALPDKKILEGKNHKDRLEKFKNWAELGNVKMEFGTTLSNLSNLRDSARYLSSNDFKKEDPNKIKVILKEMIDFAEKNIE